MPLSSIIKQHCKTCGAIAVEVSRLDLGDSKWITLQCGHMCVEDTISAGIYDSLQSADGRKPMPFQIETLKFLEQCNARALVAHEQGLGKTLIAAFLIKLHKKELLPAVIVTKTTLKKQWMWELVKIVGSRRVQVINTSKEIAIPGMDFYVITYDLIKNENMFDDINPQLIILDECQAVKNHLSDRAKAIQRVAINIPHIIGLSGTFVKNHAGEAFTMFNLIAPQRYPEYNRFIRDECDSYETQWGYKVGGVKDLESWKERTKDFYIRKTQAEVLPDLFALKQPRKFHHVELDKKFERAYDKGLDELEDLMYREDSDENMANKLAIMNKLRQICGLSKTVECIDLVTDHILSTSRKIIIGCHHHAVVDLLENNLNVWLKDGGYNPCVIIRAGDNGTDKITRFSQDNTPICIASTLASGEGLDGLQLVCSDMIILERQWNPANEEQLEGRIGRIGQTKPCNFIYPIAVGKIDDFFTELVEEKRSYVAGALDGIKTDWNESSLLKELATILVTKGRKKWTL